MSLSPIIWKLLEFRPDRTFRETIFWFTFSRPYHGLGGRSKDPTIVSHSPLEGVAYSKWNRLVEVSEELFLEIPGNSLDRLVDYLMELAGGYPKWLYTWQFCENVTFFGMVNSRDPFKWYQWPSTRGVKRSRLESPGIEWLTCNPTYSPEN